MSIKVLHITLENLLVMKVPIHGTDLSSGSIRKSVESGIEVEVTIANS